MITTTQKWFSIICALLILNCSSNSVDVTSGQGGEAIVVTGVAQTSNGISASGEKIVLAPYDYSALDNDRKFYSTTSDSNGTFSFEIEGSGNYTISSRNDSSLIYKSNIQITDNNTTKDLGTLSFEQGTEVTILPWWKENSDSSMIAVQGTPWTINMKEIGLNPVRLPNEELTLIHTDGESSDTLVETVDDSLLGAHDSLDEIKYLIDDSLYYNIYYIRIDNYSDTIIYSVNWGDGTPDEDFTSNRLDHTYTKDGTYTVIMIGRSKYDIFKSTPVYTHKLVIDGS